MKQSRMHVAALVKYRNKFYFNKSENYYEIMFYIQRKKKNLLQFTALLDTTKYVLNIEK